MLTPTNSFLLLGVLTSVPILVKIDQEIATVRVLADGYTYTQLHIGPERRKLRGAAITSRRFYDSSTGCPCVNE